MSDGPASRGDAFEALSQKNRTALRGGEPQIGLRLDRPGAARVLNMQYQHQHRARLSESRYRGLTVMLNKTAARADPKWARARWRAEDAWCSTRSMRFREFARRSQGQHAWSDARAPIGLCGPGET